MQCHLLVKVKVTNLDPDLSLTQAEQMVRVYAGKKDWHMLNQCSYADIVKGKSSQVYSNSKFNVF